MGSQAKGKARVLRWHIPLAVVAGIVEVSSPACVGQEDPPRVERGAQALGAEIRGSAGDSVGPSTGDVTAARAPFGPLSDGPTVSAEPSAPPPAPAVPTPSAVAEMRGRLSRIPPGDLLVVEARVDAVDAAWRVPPASLYPSRSGGPHIMTTATLSITGAVCGFAAPDATIRAAYMGGFISGEEGSFGEEMPFDLPVGSTYIFVLSRVGDEYFVQQGQRHLLRKTAADEFVNWRGMSIGATHIPEMCP